MLDWMGLISLLISPVTGVVSYVAGKKKADNDFLVKLQGSINLLVDENTKLLRENLELKKQISDLQAKQEQMAREIARLRRDLKNTIKCGG